MSGFQDVPRGEFTRRLVRATEQTAFHGARPFFIGFEPLTGVGAKIALVDSVGKIRTIVRGKRPASLDGIRAGKISKEDAREIVSHWLTDFLFADLKVNRAEWFRVYAPYCIARLESRVGEPTLWLPLNRLYKPLGIASYFPFVDYEDFRTAAIVLGCDPAEILSIWTYSCGSDWHWLYNDDAASLRDYFVRLNRLETAVEHAQWSRPKAKKSPSRPRGVKSSR